MIFIPMNIPTPASLRRIRRKLDRQRIEAGKLHAHAQEVIARMYREGQSLRLSFDRRLGPTWNCRLAASEWTRRSPRWWSPIPM
jgi:hypothetical protein